MSTHETDGQLDLPAGYAARATTLDDIDAIVALRNAWSQAHFGENHCSAEEYRIELTRPEIDLAQDAIVVHDAQGTLVAELHIEDLSPHNAPRVIACVHPAHQGRGIGRALMVWSDDRVCRCVSKAPADAEVVCQRAVAAVDQAALRLLERMGYSAVRHFFSMQIDLTPEMTAYPWPSALTLRTYRDDDLLPLVAVLDEVFSDHWGHVERPEADRIAMFRHYFVDAPDFDPSLNWLVTDDERIVAFCLCTPMHENNPKLGYAVMLGVQRPYRRQGLAQALLRTTFAEYARRGYDAVGLDVDAGNLTGALGLYEKVGMYVHRRWVLYEKIMRPGRKMHRESLDG